jgi:HEAT repeat protein
MYIMSSHRIPWLLCLAAMLAAPPARAQVPRFDNSPFSTLAGLRSLDPSTRRSSAAGLARHRRNAEVRNALIKTLHQDPDVTVRQAAATSLARMGARGRLALQYAAVCDPDPGTRQGLTEYTRRARVRCESLDVTLLLTDPIPKAEDDLLAYLKHPSGGTRRAAMKALSKLRSSRGIQKIWMMASQDPVWSLRARALRILVKVYGKKSVKVLRHTLTQDPDIRVRSRALGYLAKTKARSAAKLIAASARVERVPAMQLAAVKALVRLGTKPAVNELGIIARSHENEDTRAAAVEALAGMKGNRKLVKTLVAQVLRKDRSGKVRAAALKVLATDNSDTACIARAESIDDPHPAVRAALIAQLSRCKPTIAGPAVRKAAKDDEDPAVRLSAVKVLIKFGAAKSMGTLVHVLQRDQAVEVRGLVLKVIKSFPKEAQHRMLADVAKNDPEPDLRRTAVKALTHYSAAAAVAPLAHVLERDREQDVRLEAARSLGRYKDALAYKALTRAAESDPSVQVRKVAATGASKSPAQKAWINSLLPQTIDPSPAVRLRALTQLCKLRVPRTYRAMVRALWMDESPQVRMAVARGFADIDHPLVDVGLVVAHDTDADGAIVRTVEQAQTQRVERLKGLLERTRSDKTEDRVAAVNDLYPSPFKHVRQALEKLVVDDEDPGVRYAAAKALAMYQDRRALQTLMKASRTELHAKTRQYKIKLYNTLRARWTAARRTLQLGALMQQARSGNLTLKLRAISAMGALGDRRAFNTLREAAKSSQPQVRYAAVAALAIFGDKGALARAISKEQDPKVKQMVLQLKYLRGKGEDQLVAALTSDKEDEVLAALHQAAIKRYPKAVPWLVRVALMHLNKEIRLAAVRTLVGYDHSLASWAVHVAAQHDASKKIRKAMWRWAVYSDVKGE